ncbi:MAG: F0F1 ATP synthase subunit epsilon [Caldilineaceae bacterium]|nr:F0F1 ATP synthase subunit epsilon [Caldilineaceae bacterium]MBP8106079.1 F0F1 ATP synthase subunit epsilon [Caldilineaceae bacterium]MBP8121915.1 F0F1 ATP synthase subunit epsilon [Caldilineaceae bacterium]MBP9073345.1 F0F1 ATP synthase subunit epsilon [Caldilineaceae bacterium]
MGILVEIVTPRRLLFSEEVDMVTLPGSEGQMGVMRSHAPLLTTLDAGEIVLHRGGKEDEYIAVSGGIAEVRPNKVIILADTAERADEIDVKRAEEARARARQMIEEGGPVQRPVLEMALRRSNVRVKVAQRRKSHTRLGSFAEDK